MCGGQACDPRGLGINPLVQQIWNQMPLPNDPQFSNTGNGIDGINAQGYLGSLALPQIVEFLRGPHRPRLRRQVEVHVELSLLQLSCSRPAIRPRLTASGQYTATAPRPQKPDYIVGGLTGQLTSNLTNEFRVSYLRNFWQWSDLGGVLRSSPVWAARLRWAANPLPPTRLIPTNVNSQNTRQRFWDGHDQFYSDNLSWLHGNHLFQFGGSYMRNYDFHSRNDNGVGIDTSITYQITNGDRHPDLRISHSQRLGCQSGYQLRPVLFGSAGNCRPVAGDVHARGPEPDPAAAVAASASTRASSPPTICISATPGT